MVRREDEMLEVGTRVKFSLRGTQADRDWWLQAKGGRHESAARQHYEKQLARRGVVLAAKDKPASHYEIKWDDGPISQTISYFVCPE